MRRTKNLPSDFNTNHLNTQITDDPGYEETGFSTKGQASILDNANNVRVKNSSFNIITNINTARKPKLSLLYQRVAPNAILNDGGRADDAKCHPGTREEVIRLIERWMDSAGSKRILWMSGPAGGGKTAIMKTIAERSAKQGFQTVNFFFFRGDSTRTGAQPVVPTLLYQLFELYPPSSEAVSKIIATRPRILDGSIAKQCTLISALFPIMRQSSPARARVILLVDGLDECDVDAERSQKDVLRALEDLVTGDDSPFRLLVASRPEAHIKLAFNQLSSQAETIFLDEEYHPESDIRLFVTEEFDSIKASHPNKHSLPVSWPSPLDVEEIVAKSSGQFIFAATVMRYIARASTVPSLSLERVKGIVPSANNSPFTHLDSIYLYILSRADDSDVMCSMFSLALLQQTIFESTDLSLRELLCIYDSRFNQARVESCVSELSAIIQLTASGDLKFYHASLPDFLVDKDRSGTHWIDVDAFRAKALVLFWKMPRIRRNEFMWRSLQILVINDLQRPTSAITHALLNLPFPDWSVKSTYPEDNLVCGTEFMNAIYKLYYADDVKMYKRILRRFIYTLVSRDLRPDLDNAVPYVRQYFLFYQGLNGCFKVLNIIHRTK